MNDTANLSDQTSATQASGDSFLMNSFRRGVSFKNRLFLSFAASGILSSAAMAAFSYYNGGNEISGSVFVLSAVVTGVSLLCGLIFGMKLAQPLVVLGQAARETLNGRKSAALEKMIAADEVGQIAGALSRLCDKESQAVRIKTAVDTADAGCVIADEDLNILYINKTLMNMFYGAADFFRREMPEVNLDKILEQKLDIFHGSSTNRQRIRHMLADLKTTYRTSVALNEKHYLLTVNPVFDAGGRKIGYVTEWSDKTAEIKIEKELGEIFKNVARGDFSKRAAFVDDGTFVSRMAAQTNEAVDQIAVFMRSLNGAVMKLDGGYLDARMEGDFEGQYSALQKALNDAVARLEEVVVQVAAENQKAEIISADIASYAETLSAGAEQQAASIEETNATMEEMAATVKHNANNAGEADGKTQTASTKAAHGARVVASAIDSIRSIESGSDRIKDIVNVIDGIAFQTNLLALNAAVEAARAGDAGKGFAVVAAEVRVLAQRSAVAASEIRNLITEANESVKIGVEHVLGTGEALNDITRAINGVAGMIRHISVASQEQASGVTQISVAIQHMDQTTQQNAELSDKCAIAARNMRAQVETLSKSVTFFKSVKKNEVLKHKTESLKKKAQEMIQERETAEGDTQKNEFFKEAEKNVAPEGRKKIIDAPEGDNSIRELCDKAAGEWSGF